MRMRPEKLAKLAGYMIVVGIGISIVAIICGAKTNISLINGELVLSGPFQTYEKTKKVIVEETNTIGANQIVEVSSQNNHTSMIKQEANLKDIKRLDISVDTIDVNILAGDAYSMDMTYRKDIKLEYQVKDNTLFVEQEDHIQWNKSNMGYKRGTINIYIPKDQVIEYMNIDMGMGSNEIRDVQIEELELECGFGNVELKNVTLDRGYIEGGMGSIRARGLVSQDLDVTIGMGSVDIEGDLRNQVNIEGGMGELTLETKGIENEYNFDIQKGLGSISINGKQSTGLEDVKINNDASNSIYVEGGMGSIRINTGK